MLTVIDKRGQLCPVFICDVCGKRIRRADEAIARLNKPGEVITFAHGDCDDGDSNYVEDLNAFLVYLENNTPFNRKDAQFRGEILASVGGNGYG
jgi:hypothetical protein